MDAYRWLTPESQRFLEKDYLLPGQTVDERVTVIAETAERILSRPGYAAKFKDYFRRGWFSLSSPIWANFGNKRALPISCYGVSAQDDTADILRTHAEVGMQTKHGGGTSVWMGNVRGRACPIADNGESDGSVHLSQMFDKLINVMSQGKVRRGNCAVWWPITHKDTLEVLDIRSDGHPIQDLSYGVTVSDEWLRSMVAGDESKRIVWAKLLATRVNTGYPYLFFEDNVNRAAPEVYRDLGLIITHSNLCTEILEYDGPDESFVCDLASANILYFEEWCDTDLLEVIVYLLDAVMTEFIQKARGIPFMEKAVRFAERQRAIGVGWLGWHSYLQSKMVPFESTKAKMLNVRVAKTIRDGTLAASRKMAAEYGEPELLKGYGRRHALLQAIAPTKSSSFILGQVSEGIEPFRSNYEVKDRAKGTYSVRNPHLRQVLAAKGADTPEVWDSILKSGGSVQHLECLDRNEKDVFKTFEEISPKEMVIQAAQRQKYIDQGQSLNLFVHPDTPARELNALILFAWEQGVKTLYYQYSKNAAQSFARDVLACKSCEA